MKAWDDSTVSATVHDSKFTARPFSSSYLYLLSETVFHFELINAAFSLETQISVYSKKDSI